MPNAMRAANERTVPELDLAITRFLQDFQDIIREHVERALKKVKGRTRVKRSAPKASRATKRKPKRARSNAQTPEQLSLF